MSFPVFKDFDKCANDIITEDYDSKFSLKIKSAGPSGTTITTNTQYVDKDNKQALKPKVSLKWPHESGFTLEKLEFSPDCKMTVETSLTGAVPNLKVEFKGNDGEKADLSLKYTAPCATFTGDFDINNLAKAETSVSAGHGAFTGGACAKFANIKDDSGSKLKATLGVGVGYTVPNTCFTALRAKDNFSAYGLLVSYTGMKGAAFVGSVDYSPKATMATAAASYKYDATTTIKGKVSCDGVLAASVKKNFDKKFSVVGSLEVPTSMKCMKWGLNATLG